MKTFSIFFFLISISTYAVAEIYKWVDENGHVKFSDKSQHAHDDYYVPKTGLSSYEGGRSDKALRKKVTNQTKKNYSVTRNGLKKNKGLKTKAQMSSLEKAQKNGKKRSEGSRSSFKGRKSIAKTQTQHDRKTNYDGYGSELNRYQNAIIMKTHNSVIKGGNMEYWNGLDDYYYNNRYRAGSRRHRLR